MADDGDGVGLEGDQLIECERFEAQLIYLRSKSSFYDRHNSYINSWLINHQVFARIANKGPHRKCQEVANILCADEKALDSK